MAEFKISEWLAYGERNCNDIRGIADLLMAQNMLKMKHITVI